MRLAICQYTLEMESIMGVARRKRKQAVQNMNHLDKRKRPNYKKTYTTVAESISKARRAAAMEAARARKKK